MLKKKIANIQLYWLELILFERFGHKFKLFFLNGNLILNLKGSSKIIEFSNLEPNFYNYNGDICSAEWDPKKEGFFSLLNIALPAPGLKYKNKTFIKKNKTGFLINYDILGLTYWMLNRIEEISNLNLDTHQRFLAKNSHAFKYNYLDIPIIDEWLNILSQVIKRLWPSLKLKNHEFKFDISHDVDRPFQYMYSDNKKIYRQLIGDIFKRNNFKLGINRYLDWAAVKKGNLKRDPFNTFKWIMDISDKNGLKSTFNFLSQKTHQIYDGDYSIKDPNIINLIKNINSRGHFVGLHSSYNSYLDSKKIMFEFNELKRVCESNMVFQSQWGCRAHYLRFKNPKTLRDLSIAGVDYDQSLTYPDKPGFRSGTCFDYPAFDPINLKMLNIRVKPLIVMECSVSKYMSLGYGTKFRLILKNLKQKCQLVKGTFSLLWHNSELQDERQIKSYINIMEN